MGVNDDIASNRYSATYKCHGADLNIIADVTIVSYDGLGLDIDEITDFGIWADLGEVAEHAAFSQLNAVTQQSMSADA